MEVSVAIKKLKDHCVHNVVHEFVFLSLCIHKNILAPFKLIGRRILVTEYMKTGTIEKYLNNEGVLTGDKQKDLLFWKWATDVAEGMSYLHSCQILHLDLHAGNILIKDDNTAVIADFGQARGKRSDIDTPQMYSSQMLKWTFVVEVVKAEKISTKTDVLFFGWLLSNFLQIDYKPSWKTPLNILPHCITQQQQELIKLCLNRSCSDRPSFDCILSKILSNAK